MQNNDYKKWLLKPYVGLKHDFSLPKVNKSEFFKSKKVHLTLW